MRHAFLTVVERWVIKIDREELVEDERELCRRQEKERRRRPLKEQLLGAGPALALRRHNGGDAWLKAIRPPNTPKISRWHALEGSLLAPNSAQRS
jgi:hypothetical protein